MHAVRPRCGEVLSVAQVQVWGVSFGDFCAVAHRTSWMYSSAAPRLPQSFVTVKTRLYTIVSFIHSLTREPTLCQPLFQDRDMSVNKTDKVPALVSLFPLLGKTDYKQAIGIS